MSRPLFWGQASLRLLEDENHKLKKLVADQALDNMVLKDLLAKKS